MRAFACSVEGIVVALALSGCGGGFNDDYNLIDGLRLLGVKAEPPEVAVGEKVTLTSLALDTDGSPIDIAWDACMLPRLGTGDVNPDCLRGDSAPYLLPLGRGAAIQTTMPRVTMELLGPPDATEGFYLPIRMRLGSHGQSLDAIERLRLAIGTERNHNPSFKAVYEVSAPAPDGGAQSMTLLDEMTPRIVHAGDSLKLRARFVEGSAETYSIYNADLTVAATPKEELSIGWFTSGGQFSTGSTGEDVDTTLKLEKHLPAIGSLIDIYLVGRDERGGSDFAHRQLLLQ